MPCREFPPQRSHSRIRFQVRNEVPLMRPVCSHKQSSPIHVCERDNIRPAVGIYGSNARYFCVLRNARPSSSDILRPTRIMLPCKSFCRCKSPILLYQTTMQCAYETTQLVEAGMDRSYVSPEGGCFLCKTSVLRFEPAVAIEDCFGDSDGRLTNFIRTSQWRKRMRC